MELISQHVKGIMEGCKDRAREAGLSFDDETLEYIVTNRDLIELSPKIMIPTLYDYWVHDVEVLREKGKYELYPHNPYETVINTRPAISYYNDNNPDWLNVMIFYHVIGHIDFFQNNEFFRHTWDDDFNGQALADKRLLARLRTQQGRWVDYLIEFARSLDNLVGFYPAVERAGDQTFKQDGPKTRVDYYFDVFLQQVKQVPTSRYIQEIERYNQAVEQDAASGEKAFFAGVNAQYNEFESFFEKYRNRYQKPSDDLLHYLMQNSPFLHRDENKWMLQVLEIVRNTALFFQPQIRTKIMNEGWASYWHERLFLQDNRIQGHETDFARIHASVTSMPQVGLNPYALGLRLFQFIEQSADQGRYSHAFERLTTLQDRHGYNAGAGEGRDLLFHLRRYGNDFLLVNDYVDQDFVDRFNLFVVDKRLNQERMVYEYVVRSKKSADYRQMLFDTLYHPPKIEVDTEKTTPANLYLDHRFEHKPLVKDYIENTMLGLEYLWGGAVHLRTTEVSTVQQTAFSDQPVVEWQPCIYSMRNKQLNRQAA